LKVQWVSYIVWKFRELWSTNGLLEWLPFRVVSKYPQLIICFCHNTCIWQTDGQTDRQTELRQQSCALHYMQSHGKNRTRDFTYPLVYFAFCFIARYCTRQTEPNQTLPNRRR